MSHLTYEQLQHKLQDQESYAVVGSEKPETTQALAETLGVGVLGINIGGEEPATESPRHASEWKLHEAHELPATPEIQERMVWFVSDIIFIDPRGETRHKLSRKGIISSEKRHQLVEEFSRHLAEPSDDNNARRVEIMDILQQDETARHAANADGLNPLQELQALYQEAFAVTWKGAFMYSYVFEGQTYVKVCELDIVGDFPTGIPANQVASNFNPNINAGLPLIETGPEFGARFYAIVTEEGGQERHVEIPHDMAQHMVVNKVLPAHLMKHLVENPGETITPILTDTETFSYYTAVRLTADLLDTSKTPEEMN
jgi:hypothetical protein